MAIVISPVNGQGEAFTVTTSATASSIDTSGANAVYCSNRTANSVIFFRISASSVTATSADFALIGDCPVIIPVPHDASFVKINAIATSATQLTISPIKHTPGQ